MNIFGLIREKFLVLSLKLQGPAKSECPLVMYLETSFHLEPGCATDDLNRYELRQHRVIAIQGFRTS